MIPLNPFVEAAKTPWTVKGFLARCQCPDCRQTSLLNYEAIEKELKTAS
jgi:hypothetical protein